MAAKKNRNGVQATIERLTGKTPCPEVLRNSLNKYLYDPRLFAGARKTGTRVLGKLSSPDTDALVKNLLDLDEVLRGDPESVVAIVTGDMPPERRRQLIEDAAGEMQRRLDIYRYWVARMRSLQDVLDREPDLRREALGPLLSAVPEQAAQAELAPFALRAVQELERSEERARSGPATADELAARADAYLALGDNAGAGQNARRAIALDGSHGRAWFVRVIAALRQRNMALGESRRQRMIAQEIAEPMSPHESMALELADEAADTAARHRDDLEAILPEALLHWPRSATGFQHPDQRRIVRDLFVHSVFGVAVHGRRHDSSEQCYRVNGLGPEWDDERARLPYPASHGHEDGKLPFSEAQTAALRMLLAERDGAPHWYFDPLDAGSLAKDVKLLHLRWLLRADGYPAHWKRLKQDAAECTPRTLQENIFNDARLSVIWQSHQHLDRSGGNAQAIVDSLESWRARSSTMDGQRRAGVLLHQYAFLYHHCFVRKAYEDCMRIARRGRQQFGEGDTMMGMGMPHPYAEQIAMPVQQALYWAYLEALAAVCAANTGSAMDDAGARMLADAAALRRAFADTRRCFWTESEEYEGGGGEDWEVEPYGIDLREAAPWEGRLDAWLAARSAPLEPPQPVSLFRGDS